MFTLFVRFLLFVIISPMFLIGASFNNHMAATSLSTVGKSTAQCVKAPLSSSYGSASRYTLRFTNFCPDKVYISVCVLYDDGTSKLYSSGNRIKPAGFMQIYTEPFKRPVDVKMAFGPFQSVIPPPCTG